jgi:hypothetical protein
MYTTRNFKSKKDLKTAVLAGESIGVFSPGPFGTGNVLQGWYAVEGPHYPQPHKWYAEVLVEAGKVTKVK